MLAGTQTLFEFCEDLVAGEGLHSSGIYIVDTTPNLLFPLFTELEAIQTRSDSFDQISTFTGRQLERGLEDLVRFGHRRRA